MHDYGMAHRCWSHSPYLLTRAQQPLVGAQAACLCLHFLDLPCLALAQPCTTVY